MTVLSRGLHRWLLDGSDPSVQVRVLTGVLGRPDDDPEVERATGEIGRRGWAAQILATQLPAGQWTVPLATPDSLYRPKYIATTWQLIVLAELGMSGADRRVRRSVELFLRLYGPGPGDGLGGRGSEACFTGNAVRLLTTFGWGEHRLTRRAVAWIVRTQKSDGGWHCFPSPRGTLDAWEPLAALAALPAGERTPAIDRAVERGAEFFLRRGLLREGRHPYAPWTRLHYPNHYYYDLLVGLAMLVRLGYGRDRRLGPALDRLESMRRADGRWELGPLHPDVEGPDRDRYLTHYVARAPYFPFGLETPGLPSRWITATALAVLRTCGRL